LKKWKKPVLLTLGVEKTENAFYGPDEDGLIVNVEDAHLHLVS